MSRRPASTWLAASIGIALGLGVLVRALPAFEGPLTTGDGGLILAMVEDIREAHFSLPESTSYNGAGIPFLYPPLALFATAAVTEVSGADTATVMRGLAFLVSLATLGAFLVVALRLLEPAAASGATLAYALMPHAFDGIVSGGGLTRGLGLLLSLAAIIVASSRVPMHGRRVLAVGALLGLAALSHPQVVIFGAAGVAVVMSRTGSLGQAIRPLLAAGLVALLVLAPWLLVVSAEHGSTGVLAAAHRWEPVAGIVQSLDLDFSGAPFADLFLVFGVLGLVATLAKRQWVLPALVASLLIVETGPGFIAAVPWALAAGAGIGFIIDALGPVHRPLGRVVRVGIASAALFLVLVSSLASPIEESSRLQRVSVDQSAAMRWIAAETDPETTFIVATTVAWGWDEFSEWFPAVTHRHSVATVQGSEWLGPDGFEEQLDHHWRVLACTSLEVNCMADWATSAGFAEAWIVIPKGQLNGPLSASECCPAIRDSVRAGGLYEVVYDEAGATIARPVDEAD